MSLVTIQAAHNGSELLVLRSRLEAAGINYYLKNEFVTQLMNYIPSFMVELQVSSIDLEKAQEILNETKNN